MNDQTRKVPGQTTSTTNLGLLMGAALLLLCNLGTAQITSTTEPTASTSSVRAQLIGSWRLVSRQSRRASGEIEPDRGLSETPLGILIYDQSGHVAA